jgi:protein ImuA
MVQLSREKATTVPGLERLREAIQALDARSKPGVPHKTIRTGWRPLDAALRESQAGLHSGTIHEWFGEAGRRPDRGATFPPLTILAHLARNAIAKQGGANTAVWIGRRCRPYPPLLSRFGIGAASLLDHSIFVDALEHEERVWAIDIALRSRAVAAVIGDASGLSMSESRRIQLAAGAGGALGLIVRPPRELGEISAAQTRWLVRSEPSSTGAPRWRVELLRCKGVRPLSEDARQITVRWSHETGDVCVVPDALDRPLEKTRPIRIRHAV